MNERAAAIVRLVRLGVEMVEHREDRQPLYGPAKALLARFAATPANA